jgi:starch-binding outer membrane protein, SusD/RagB family
MKKIYHLIFITLLVFITACNDWVTDTPFTNDKILDEQLNIESNIDFMVTGVLNRLTDISEPMLMVDGLSDQLYFDLRMYNATFPQYQEIDLATNIPADNNSINAALYKIYVLRMEADTLVWRCSNKIAFTNNDLKNKGLFNAYLGGGYARFCLAAWQGRDKTTGGGCISGGPFLSSNALYQQAIARWKEALKYTSDAWSKKVVNSLIGKTYLYLNDYTNSVAYLNQGLLQGDKAWIVNATIDQYNYYVLQAGSERNQWGVDDRFANYIAANPEEAKRIPLVAKTYRGFNYWQQAKHLVNSDQTFTPLVLINWQEVNLMKAECTLRGVSAGDPKTLINDVRSSHGMTSLLTTIPTLDDMYVERDKELFLTGNRLVDERRFNKLHIAGMWQYLPIPQNEINKNPNLQ